jgi:RHS repeat-associated protein
MSAPQQQFISRPVQELFGHHPGYGFAGFAVSTAIGNYTHTAVDLGFPGGLLGLLDATRTYNSLAAPAGPLGSGWTAAFSARLAPTETGLLHHTAGPVTFSTEDGRALIFTPNPAGGYNRPQDLDADLTGNSDGSFALTYNSGLAAAFDANGRLTGRSQEGQSVSYDYDSDGLVLRAAHSAGLHLTFSYDTAGRLTQVEASDGRAVSYAYAADGTLNTVTDPAGGVTRYETANGQITKVTDPDGNVVTINYYESSSSGPGRVTQQDLPTGSSAKFDYDPTTGLTTVTTTPSGAVMTFQADAAGRMTTVTDPAGKSATFSYDTNGYLAGAVSPGGTQLTQAHDARGNLLTSTFGGATTSYRYDDSDRPTSVTDPTGGTVRYSYTAVSQVPAQVTDQTGGTTQLESANGLVTRLTDADGNTTTYDYDIAGNLASVTDPAGQITQFSYDSGGRGTAQTSPSGATTRYTYDAAGRVTTVADPLGNITSYAYSPTGRLLEITDPTGAVTAHAYDASGQLTAVTDPLSRVTTYAYDSDGNLAATTAPGGAVTTTEYDQAGRVTAITDPDGNTTRHGYDADGNLTTVTDPLGHVTRRGYDARGNLTQVTDPAGGVTRYAYDATDRQITATDPDGGVWQTGYDLAGRVITSTDSAGAVTRQAWTPAGNLATRADPLGRETTYTYRPTGQPATIADPQGGISQYGYDADGRRISATTPARLRTGYRYDAAGRLVATVDPRGWITRYEYNPRGQQTAQISPSGAITRDRYDPAGQRTETIDPNDSPTRFGYDDAGHLTQVTDAKGGVTRYAYDAAGQQISSTDPLRRTTTRSYDAAGNLITLTDPTGRAQHLAYDAALRLIRRSADDGTEVTYTYDAAGRRISMTDATGTTHYSYDGNGRLLAVTDPDGGVTAAAYDAAGQQTSLRYPSDLQLSFQYDLNGNLTALQDSRAGDAAYALDPDGRLLTEQLPGRLARRYRYDHGLLSRFTVLLDGHPVTRTSITHDPDGRVATERDDRQFTRYRYDPAGQLTGIFRENLTSRPGPPRSEPGRDMQFPEIQLTYDVIGNRTSLRRGDAETRYHYDAASQLLDTDSSGVHTEYRYDSCGRLTGEQEAHHHSTISYNGFGQPVATTFATPGGDNHLQAAFNGNGLLASLALTSEIRDAQRGSSVRYLWSPDQVPQILSQRAEPRLDDAEHDDPGRLDADFAYGYGRTFASSEHGAATFHTDAYGSAIRTEDTEPWVQASRYDAFGVPEGVPGGLLGDEPERPQRPVRPVRERPGEAEHTRPGQPRRERGTPEPGGPRFGYRGELCLGPLTYLRARSYDTRLGRFTTPDPLASVPRQIAAVSPYTYANNDPLNTTDPLGLFSFGSAFSDVADAVKHVVAGAKHVAHAVTGAVTRGADILAGTVAHAFDFVRTTLDHVADNARKDAARLAQVVRDTATRVVRAVGDAVSRSAGMVKSAATQALTWIKKHNQVIGKVGTFLGNISGKLALVGAVIAPIPGLDALTPVLEGAALATSLGAIAAQGVAKAAGDQNITYGDLLGDALGAIPGGGDAEDLEQGIITASHITEDAADDENVVYRGLAENEDPAGGLTARAPGTTDVSPISHVAGKDASPWISTTKSREVAITKYGKFGVVAIDLSRVRSEIVDISGGFPETPGMFSNWAARDKEVLIRDFVPPEAIRRISL